MDLIVRQTGKQWVALQPLRILFSVKTGAIGLQNTFLAPRCHTTRMAASHIAEITVKHPDLTLTRTLKAVPDLHMEIESQPATSSDLPGLFYSVKTSSYQKFESELDSDSTVAEWECVSEFNAHRIYRVRLTSEVKIITPKITEHGLRVLAVTNSDGGWHLRLHAPDRSRIAHFQTYCQQEDVECQIHKLYSADNQIDTGETGVHLQLTDRQHEVAQTATDMGYFDQEGASSEEVAKVLDITPSTLSSHLRKVKMKMFKQHFGS
ncbi:helix-turn-helix domain-containing protein [Natrinema sp. SYSU A 869]|uniref:helix-turn-helix domain-containing protein n=1 Tax=Natrinema sp. SYSU A 869 TaxID=2871694 RepID=UPI001CA3BFAD|nr:helix-turn-helix domain-containing protein [Natrinema sp. SYSU A 869]